MQQFLDFLPKDSFDRPLCPLRAPSLRMFVFELDALVLREEVSDLLLMLFASAALLLDRTLSGAIDGCKVLFLFLLLDVLDGIATGCGLSPHRPSRGVVPTARAR